MFRALVSAFVVSLAALGCDSDGPLSPGERRALAQAEFRWANRGFQNYTFEFRRLCFCDPLVNQWARVDVVDGEVVRASLVEDGTPIPLWLLESYPTVEELFAQIRAPLNSDIYADLIVEFDPTLGFPTRVSYVGRPTVADADVDNRLRNAGALRPSSAPAR